MQKSKSVARRLFSFALLVVAIYVLVQVYGMYKQRDFNEFIRAEKLPYTSNFIRDNEVKLGDKSSYKIQSNKLNDAMFFKEVNVEPGMPYKVSCMVKTENIQAQDDNIGGGAQIVLEGSTERSKAIQGTNDWQELEFYFDSKNRTTVNIGFRLGGYDSNCTGTAWFTNFKCEQGVQDKTRNWNFVCFLFKNIDVNIGGTNYKFSLSSNDMSQMRENMQRFKATCESFSKNQMEISYDIIEINEPITTISYDEEHAYYINPTDIEKLIDKYIQEKEYDHIFAAVRLGDSDKRQEIPVNDWIGLGGMDYHNIGFSNIRLPNDKLNYTYRYDGYVNQFPEEVFLHEFLHSLERTSEEYGYDTVVLHDNAKYGYQSQRLVSLRDWYKDYMQQNIDFNRTKSAD